MDVLVNQDQTDLSISSKSVEALVKGFLVFADIHFDEVSIHFVDTKTISALHRDYFDDPNPTDCISFPMDDSEDEGYRVMGDVFVCPATAIEYVALHGGDIYQETTLYVVHGLLHLLGYDDIEDEDREEMRAAEKRYLDYIAQKKLWLKPLSSK